MVGQPEVIAALFIHQAHRKASDVAFLELRPGIIQF